MKRFTDTAKWDDPWFRQLPGVQKLVFLYVIDRCNNAGFWEVDEDAIAWHTKVDPKHIQGAWEGLKRGIQGASGWVWVRRFLRHQKNEELNPINPAHKQIIAMLREQRERFADVPEFQQFIAPYKGLFSPIGIGIGQVKVKEKRENFVPPTLEECSAYADEIGWPRSNVPGWRDHFISNGWKVGGKSKMVDWKAALRGAKSREHKQNGQQAKKTFL